MSDFSVARKILVGVECWAEIVIKDAVGPMKMGSVGLNVRHYKWLLGHCLLD